MNERIRILAAGLNKHAVLLLVLLGIGIRIIGFPSFPSGLNQDEVIVGYSAMTLLREGVEPYKGFTMPVNLLSWDQGSAIVGAVAMMPTIRMFGMTALGIRLPFLIAGCLTLPLFYLMLRRLTERRIALIGLFLLAMCPWHIMISRWALDGNLLPFFLLLAFCAFLKGKDKPFPWLLVASLLYGTSLYVYGPALAVVAVLLPCLLVSTALQSKRHALHAAAAGVLFIVLALPITVYVLMNIHVLPWDTIHLGPLTIPRIEGSARFLNQGFFGHTDWIGAIRENLIAFFRVVLAQQDGTIYNALPRFGVLYGPGTAFALWGLWIGACRIRKNSRTPENALMVWIGGCAVLGLTLHANINRVNAIWLPLIAFSAIGLHALMAYPKIFRLVIIYFALWFVAFTQAYFVEMKPALDRVYQADLFGAVRFVMHRVPEGSICITDRATAPYFYVLAAGEIPSDVFRAARTTNPDMTSIGRATIGLYRCDPSSLGYVVTEQEFRWFHSMEDNVRIDRFGHFVAVTPA